METPKTTADSFRLEWHKQPEDFIVVPMTTVAQMLDSILFDETTECLNFIRRSAMKDTPALSFAGGHTIRLDQLMLMFELDKPAPAGAHVIHSCHNPRCCAPWHMSWSTAENEDEDDRTGGEAAERTIKARAGAAIRFCEGLHS